VIAVEELLSPDAELRRFSARPEMDPLTEDDALQEAQLLDVRIDALRTTVGLLFELRVATQLREANTGVLVAHGLRKISWSVSPRPTARTAWNVIASTPRCADRLFGLSLGFWPEGRLELSAERAAFFVGDVASIGAAPPDYGGDESTIQAGLAGWRSTFTPVHAVFLDPAPLL
jgi:hypothetical protein